MRSATLDDVDKLVDLEERSWKSHLKADKKKIESFINKYAAGQYVYEVDNVIRGILYTQRISSFEQLLNGKFETQTDLHSSDGTIIQLCSIAAPYPKFGNVGDLLRNYALQEARKNPQIIEVVAMTRCSKFEHSPENSPSQSIAEQNIYYEKYARSGKDPTLFFHMSGGAEIVQIVHGYRPKDADNLGNAILIRYNIRGKNNVSYLLCGPYIELPIILHHLSFIRVLFSLRFLPVVSVLLSLLIQIYLKRQMN